MSYRLPPLQQLQSFEAAARHLSFKLAAEELHVTPTAVSHSVKALENTLGVRLFRRLTRALELTEEGRAALPKLREGLGSLAAAIEATRPNLERGTLKVIAPPSFAVRWLVPRLQRFTSACPEVELRVDTSPAMVDDSIEGAALPMGEPDARGGEADVAIRFGTGSYPGFRVDELLSVEFVPVCSPKLLAGEHPLSRPDDLRHHTLLHDDAIQEEAARPSWDAWLRAAGVQDVDATRGPRFQNSPLALEAAIDGLGVALAMRELVADDIADGRLVVAFEASLPSRFAYYLVCPEATAERAAVVAFRNHLLREAGRLAAVPLARSDRRRRGRPSRGDSPKGPAAA